MTVIFHEVFVVARAVAVGWWEPHRQWEIYLGRRSRRMCL